VGIDLDLLADGDVVLARAFGFSCSKNMPGLPAG